MAIDRVSYEDVLARIAAGDPDNWAPHPDILRWRPPETGWLIKDILPRGYTTILGAPKTGKTALTLPMARKLAEAGWRVMYLSWDDSPRRMHQRLMMAGPREDLPNLWLNWYKPDDLTESMSLLGEWLADWSPDAVFIDTRGAFTGNAKPNKGSAFQSDYALGAALKNLCDRHGTSLIVTHHTRKGEESEDWLDMASGTGGIVASADAIWYVRRTRASREGVLKVTGNDLPESAWPLVLGGDMQWRPSDTVSVAQASHTRCPRAILDFLATETTGTLEEIVTDTGENRNTVRRALQDLKAEGLVTLENGIEWCLTGHQDNGPPPEWRVVPAPSESSTTQTPPPPAVATCAVCGAAMTLVTPGQTTHAGCADNDPPPPPPAPEPPPPATATSEPATESGNDELTEREVKSGISALRSSIQASRMKPVLRIQPDKRAAPPWSLITEAMTGEHRWHLTGETLQSMTPDARVLVLDRNGSYPSAMGSVPVVANALQHTGPIESFKALKTIGGLFRVEVPRWGHVFPHPLGRLAEVPDADGCVWVSTPHLRLLLRLAEQGSIPPVVVRDSWTGRATSGLFTAYSKEVQAARLRALERDDRQAYAEAKRSSSVAIRCLWPTAARSPFWRPDWSVSIRAEAAVRHWIRAQQAADGGKVALLALGAVDEAVFLVPPDTPPDIAPGPYVVGTHYGEVKIKGQMTFEEWRTRAHR